MTAMQIAQTLLEVLVAIFALFCLAYEKQIALWEHRMWRRMARIMRSFCL